MKYEPTIILGMPMIIAKHKSCEILLAEGNDWISIYTCESKEKGKGHASEAIEIIKKDYSKKRLCGSVPLNKVMEHLYTKYGVGFPYEGFPND